MEFEEYKRKRANLLERMVWVGVGTKEQAEEGFKLMEEMIKLNRDFLEYYNRRV